MPVNSQVERAPAKSVAAALSRLDWRFTDGRAVHPIEGLHPYPARFVPQLPGTLLDHLPIATGTIVLDPFVGGGTTLVECQRRCIKSVGVDVNPIACLISRVKTGSLPVGLLQAGANAVEHALANPSEGPEEAIPNLDHWFRPDIKAALAALTVALDLAPGEYRSPLRLALSSIVVRVSNQESDTRYAAVEKAVLGEDVFRLFTDAVERIYRGLSARDWNLTDAQIIEADARSLDYTEFDDPIGAVITSPPYPNAYEYWLYHKYRMYWLKHDPVAVRESEIGARPHFYKKHPHTPVHFWGQMRSVLEPAAQAMVDGGWLCVVVGSSRIHGEIVNNAQIVSSVADSLGFSCEAQIRRDVDPRRKSFNLAHARIKDETILVFSKS